MNPSKPSRAFRFTADHMLGVAGIGLATASAAFGIGMTMHGPAASFGSGEFTVFAQLAQGRGHHPSRGTASLAAVSDSDLDTTPTASIRTIDHLAETGATTIIAAITLEAVGEDSATVAIEGKTRLVRVGDEVPGAGRVLAIVSGLQPSIKTSRGLIVPAVE